ncbi:hypothetical protein N9923_00040 [bacterium]|nr:hypothetical protein [bacterium]
MEYNIVKHGDKLLQVLRDFTPHSFITDRKSNEINKQLLGLWVDHLEGDSVVQRDDKILICRHIEDAIIIDE